MKKIIIGVSLLISFCFIQNTFAKEDCYENKDVKGQIIKDFEKDKILTKEYLKFLKESSFSVSFTDSKIILQGDGTNWVFYNFYDKIYLNKEIQCNKEEAKRTFLHETLHLYWKKNEYMKTIFENMLTYAEKTLKTIPSCSKVKKGKDCLQEDYLNKGYFLTGYDNPGSLNLKLKYIYRKGFVQDYKNQWQLLPNKKYLTEKQEKEYALNEVMAHTWDDIITNISCWEKWKYDVLYKNIFNMKREVCKK